MPRLNWLSATPRSAALAEPPARRSCSWRPCRRHRRPARPDCASPWRCPAPSAGLQIIAPRDIGVLLHAQALLIEGPEPEDRGHPRRPAPRGVEPFSRLRRDFCATPLAVGEARWRSRRPRWASPLSAAARRLGPIVSGQAFRSAAPARSRTSGRWRPTARGRSSRVMSLAAPCGTSTDAAESDVARRHRVERLPADRASATSWTAWT